MNFETFSKKSFVVRIRLNHFIAKFFRNNIRKNFKGFEVNALYPIGFCCNSLNGVFTNLFKFFQSI